MSNGASKVVFFEEGKSELSELGEYLMYNPPIIGDDVTWGDDATYTVIRRNCDIQDNFVRITVRRKDDI